MPYIKQSERLVFDELLDPFLDYIRRERDNLTPGQLNYIITRLCLVWVNKVSYSEYNKLIGVLECVKQELYRRTVAKYEDEKIKENGDLF